MSIEVRLKKGDKTELITLNEPLGEDQEEWFTRLAEMQQNPIAENIIKFLRYRDKLISKLSNRKIKIEELNKMELIKKNKIIEEVESRFTILKENKAGF